MSKNALIVHGGWPGHQPGECAEIFAPFLRSEGFDVIVSNTLAAYEDTGLMARVDLIVPIWTMGEISPAQLGGLLGAVKAGVGIAGWHGGMGDAFRNSTEYHFMVGGQFVAHPGDMLDYTVRIVDHTDAITAGLTDFQVHTEQYYMHTDPGNRVLAVTTVSGAGGVPWVSGTEMPVVWKRLWGEGRVFYSSLGHAVAEFDVPETRTIMQRGMLWAARE